MTLVCIFRPTTLSARFSFSFKICGLQRASTSRFVLTLIFMPYGNLRPHTRFVPSQPALTSLACGFSCKIVGCQIRSLLPFTRVQISIDRESHDIYKGIRPIPLVWSVFRVWSLTSCLAARNMASNDEGSTHTRTIQKRAKKTQDQACQFDASLLEGQFFEFNYLCVRAVVRFARGKNNGGVATKR